MAIYSIRHCRKADTKKVENRVLGKQGLAERPWDLTAARIHPSTRLPELTPEVNRIKGTRRPECGPSC